MTMTTNGLIHVRVRGLATIDDEELWPGRFTFIETSAEVWAI